MVPEMSRFERALCQSPPWRAFASRIVLPWALQGVELGGEVLEIGSGSGAMAARLVERFPDIRLTATDYDEAMVAVARDRLAPFGDRVTVERADATALHYHDGSFDAVLSFIMLHHVIEWERALAEVARVLAPGGQVVGYDVVASPPARFVHAVERETHRLASVPELRRVVGELPLEGVRLRRGLAGLVVRFRGRKAPG